MNQSLQAQTLAEMRENFNQVKLGISSVDGKSDEILRSIGADKKSIVFNLADGKPLTVPASLNGYLLTFGRGGQIKLNDDIISFVPDASNAWGIFNEIIRLETAMFAQ